MEYHQTLLDCNLQFRKYYQSNKFNNEEAFFLSNQDQTRREVLANKYPEMDEHFEQLKNQANEPKIERLGGNNKKQKQRS